MHNTGMSSTAKIATNNVVPEFAAKRHNATLISLPPLRMYSDVAYLHWQKARMARHEIMWNFRHHIVEDRTAHVIDSVLQNSR